jgi:bacteriocin resistance YdeI/OmpD-like protein/uncharacterized protein DUF1905
MGNDSFGYVAPVLRLGDGARQYFLPIPDDIADSLAGLGRRVIVRLNGYEVKRAIHRKRDGERYLVMSRPILREAKAVPGDMVEVLIWSDPHPDAVDLAEEFVVALEQDQIAAARFYAMTPGKQRSIAHYVNSAKRVDTRIKRALELAHKLRTFTLAGDRTDDS